MRSIELKISEGTVKDLIETWLRTIGVLHDNEDLTGLELGGVKLSDGIFPMTMTISSRKEVEIPTEKET